jgi:hypothetical protein
LKNSREEKVINVTEKNLAKKLEAELERLKRFLGLGHHLRVKWTPDNNERLSGEVKGDCIYIYEEQEEPALEALRHEFLDYSVSQVIEPYKQVTNKLIMLLNEEAYRRKEELVEKLVQTLATC